MNVRIRDIIKRERQAQAGTPVKRRTVSQLPRRQLIELAALARGYTDVRAASASGHKAWTVRDPTFNSRFYWDPTKDTIDAMDLLVHCRVTIRYETGFVRANAIAVKIPKEGLFAEHVRRAITLAAAATVYKRDA